MSDFRGEVALVAFWFPTCAYCKEELPQLESIYREYRDDGLEVLAIDVYADRERGEQFVKEHNLSYRFADGDLELAQKYGVASTPTMVLIDRDGSIIKSFNRLSPDVNQEIARLLEE